MLDQIADSLCARAPQVASSSTTRRHAATAFLTTVTRRRGVDRRRRGRETTTAIWLGEGSSLRCLGAIGFPHSLGLLYAAFTAYLGFEVNEGEYKVMGLAAYGAPRFRDELGQVLHVHADGSFRLEPRFFAHTTDRDVGFSPTLEKLLGPRRLPGRRFELAASADDQRCADVAASLQLATEEALLALARAARARTGSTALCLAGGVALNALANARLAREAGFDRVFVPPAAGDAGGALGAALIGARDLGDPRPPPLVTAALGEPFDGGAAIDLARALGFSPRTVPDLPAAVAAHVAAGRVVALCRGRFEWGPRALGQRSLLADAAAPGSRERLNRVVKQREPFRPFAPAVAAEAAADYFPEAPNDMTPFMTTVCPVRAEAGGGVAVRRARRWDRARADGHRGVGPRSGADPGRARP